MTDQTSGRGSPHLDDISKHIIAELQEDGRRAFATVGKVVGLPEAAVRQRVTELADAGVRQIVAVTDPPQVGLFRQAMLAITVDGSVQPQLFACERGHFGGEVGTRRRLVAP